MMFYDEYILLHYIYLKLLIFKKYSTIYVACFITFCYRKHLYLYDIEHSKQKCTATNICIKENQPFHNGINHRNEPNHERGINAIGDIKIVSRLITG